MASNLAVASNQAVGGSNRQPAHLPAPIMHRPPTWVKSRTIKQRAVTENRLNRCEHGTYSSDMFSTGAPAFSWCANPRAIIHHPTFHQQWNYVAGCLLGRGGCLPCWPRKGTRAGPSPISPCAQDPRPSRSQRRPTSRQHPPPHRSFSMIPHHTRRCELPLFSLRH